MMTQFNERDKMITGVMKLIKCKLRHFPQEHREDLLQECITHLLTQWGSFDKEAGQFTTWAVSVALRHADKYYTRNLKTVVGPKHTLKNQLILQNKKELNVLSENEFCKKYNITAKELNNCLVSNDTYDTTCETITEELEPFNENMRVLEKMMSVLNPNRRDIIIRSFFNEQSGVEIAKARKEGKSRSNYTAIIKSSLTQMLNETDILAEDIL